MRIEIGKYYKFTNKKNVISFSDSTLETGDIVYFQREATKEERNDLCFIRTGKVLHYHNITKKDSNDYLKRKFNFVHETSLVAEGFEEIEYIEESNPEIDYLYNLLKEVKKSL